MQWREFALVPGDELLVDVSAYHGEFGVAWCSFLRAAPGSASVYPYKVQIPERGVGQYRADEILGWRRPVDVHHGLLELDAINKRMALPLWPPVQRKGEGALEFRIRYEEEAKLQTCGARGCTNRATHTWSGHPTCDDCGLPGRKGRAFPRLIGP